MGKKIDARLTALETGDIGRRVAALFRAGILDVQDGRIVALDSDASNVANALNELNRRGLLRVAAR